MLMLQNHLVDVALAQQRIGVVKVSLVEPLQYARANFLHHVAAFCKGWQPQRPALASGMLERIEQTRHLDELDRAIEISGEPQLLEVSDVPQIPDDRAHERIVLEPQLGVGKRLNQEKRPGSSFRELRCYGFPIYSRRHGDSRHDLSVELGS
jgi:hypothetical protein